MLLAFRNRCDLTYAVGLSVEEEICGESVRLALYSVRYLLGGSEKEVRETYISCTPNDDGEARKTCPPELFTVPVEEVGLEVKIKKAPLSPILVQT